MRLFFYIFCRQRVPLQVFDILQQTEVSKGPKGPPFLVFRHCETSKIFIFSFFWIFSKNFQIFPLSPNGPPFKFFDILQQTEVSKSLFLKNLALFWALDIAPTLDVPVLLVFDWAFSVF